MKKSGKDRLKCVVYESTRAPPQKEANPASLRSASPFQGKGLAWTLPPSYGRRCPEGAEVGWGKRDEKEREDRLKCVVYESTRAPLTRSPFPEGCETRMRVFSHRQSEYMHI